MAQAEGDLPRASAMLDGLRPTADQHEALETQVYQAILKRQPAPMIRRLTEILASPDSSFGYINGELHFWLGWAQEVAGDKAAAQQSWRQARSELESFLNEQPDNISIIADLTWTNLGLGDKAAALALWSGPWPRIRSRKTHYWSHCDRDSCAGGGAHGETRIALSPLCRNSCRYRILGRSLQACRSRPRFFGSIQCSMGFEMIRGSKNSWARTRTSEPATPDSEPDYLGEREDALLIQIVRTKSHCGAHIAGKDIPSARRGGKHPGWQISFRALLSNKQQF